MAAARGNPGALAVGGRRLVVGGAAGGPGPDGFFLDSSEMFAPRTNTWRTLDIRLPVARASLCAEPQVGHAALAIGGFEPYGVS